MRQKAFDAVFDDILIEKVFEYAFGDAGGEEIEAMSFVDPMDCVYVCEARGGFDRCVP